MPDIGNVDMRLKVMEKYAKLRGDSDNFDVILGVEGENIPAHRLILATQSNFFRVLLLGRNFKETNDEIVELKAPLGAFKILLSYMYTGTVDLRNYSLFQVTELLELSHRYGLPELQEAISEYLCFAVDAKNACEIFRVATLIESGILRKKSRILICLTIEGIFENELVLSFDMLENVMINCAKFARNEVKWFQMVEKFTSKKGFCTEKQKSELMKMIDFTKMTAKQLLDIVQPTHIIKDQDLIQLMKAKMSHEVRTNYDTNLISKNSLVIQGGKSKSLFKKGNSYAFHLINCEVAQNEPDCILFDLGAVYCFNHIKMVIHNWSMYMIKVSKDQETWHEVINFTEFYCKKQQMLHFAETLGRFIKIVGHESVKHNIFECNRVEVMLVTNCPMQTSGYICPTENVVVDGKAEVLDGLDNISSQPIIENGIDTSFFSSEIDEESIDILFNQPYLLSSCQLKLWDYDERKYSYKISVVCGKNLYTVSDKSDEQLSGWQTIRFSPRLIQGFKIEGTSATVGDEIRIVKFQAPAQEDIV